MSIRINLLPHREMRRERRKKDYVGLLAFVGIGAAAAAVVVALGIDQRIDAQRARNDFIRAENAKLDEQIKEISGLQAQLNGLKARQAGVESLQADRNLPVHLLDEMVRQLPDGVYLKTLKQDGLSITLTGVAQSQERVSELLRNFSGNSPWLTQPQLVEIVAGNVNLTSREQRRAFEFSMRVTLTRGPGDPAAAGAAAKPPGKV